MATRSPTASSPAPRDIWTIIKEEAKALQSAQAAAGATSVADTQSGNETILLFGGQQGSGKTSLINRFLDKVDKEPQPTVGLEYTYGRRTRAISNVKDVCHIWELGGGIKLSKLVEVPLMPGSIQNTAVFLAVDLTQSPMELANTIESCLAVLTARIEEILSNLEKRGSKRPKGLRMYAQKRYAGTEAQGPHPDKAVVRPLPLAWALVGTKYDAYRDLNSELRKHVSRLLRYYAHMFGGYLIFASDRDEAASSKTRQLISHFAFKTAPPKGETIDDNKPMFVSPGSDLVSAIFHGAPQQLVQAASVEYLKAQVTKAAAALQGKGANAAAPSPNASVFKQAWDPKYAEPEIDQACRR